MIHFKNTNCNNLKKKQQEMEIFKILEYFNVPFNMSVLLEVNLGVVFDLLVPRSQSLLTLASLHIKGVRSQRNRNAAHTSKGVPLPEVVTAFHGG